MVIGVHDEIYRNLQKPVFSKRGAKKYVRARALLKQLFRRSTDRRYKFNYLAFATIIIEFILFHLYEFKYFA